jgi:hypothetical protein
MRNKGGKIAKKANRPSKNVIRSLGDFEVAGKRIKAIGSKNNK